MTIFDYSYEVEEACVYCGNPASQIDHVHPQAAHPNEANPHTAGLLVPACGECNRIAGARIFKTLSHKREWIHWKLRRKHRRALALPYWSDQEKSELGPTLRDNLEVALKVQWVLRQRVAYKCDGRCKRGDVEPLSKAVPDPAFSNSHLEPSGSAESLISPDTTPVSAISDRFEDSA